MLATRNALVLRELVRRDFQTRYAGSALGFVWSLAMPIWQLALYYVVFSKILKLSLVGERTGNFAVYLFSGLLPWLALQEGVARASTAITDNASLVKKLRFPAELLVVAVVFGALVQEAIALAVFCGFLAVRQELAWQSLPLLLVAIPLQLVLSLGLGFLLAACQVFVRDLAQLTGIVFSAWFYLTPIVYPASYVPPRLMALLAWNPLTPLVALYRRALIGGSGPLPAGTIWLCVCALTALGVGTLAFRALRTGLVDEI